MIAMNIEYTRRLEKIESVLDAWLPASVDPDWVVGGFADISPAVLPVHAGPLADPARDLMSRGGKRWRPLLMVLSCELAGGGARAYELTPLVELAHTASLIHDDIEDGAEERRGKPAVHVRYGEDVAINCGSWLYFHALSVLDGFAAPESTRLALYEAATLELRRLHLGQAMDIRWHRDPTLIPTRAEYEAMVSLKTGTLSRMAAKIGAIAGGMAGPELRDFEDLATFVGVGFQVIDDVLNLTTGNPGKKRGDDIVEGKKSLPVILHLERRPEDLSFLSASFERARGEGISSPSVEAAISALTASGAVDDARAYGTAQIARACMALRERYTAAPVATLIAELFESMIPRFV